MGEYMCNLQQTMIGKKVWKDCVTYNNYIRKMVQKDW
jgi:hypothetical protein